MLVTNVLGHVYSFPFVPGKTVWPNSAPDSLAPKNWKLEARFDVFEGAATASATVLASVRRVEKCMVGLSKAMMAAE